ncbi:bacterial transcriptional activator domain-containing protein [Aeromicrobium sp. NPDC092404]|uniref:bacterial transcriptional activator domain-containing protein n=1 Tax=Aeromicrobium sp. NPDC092404 TaxID=3154976 RepID=UPI003448AA9F
MVDQIEIRMLGRLWVRRANGALVPSSHWAAGKTTDLLRLLAVQADQPVSSETLVAALWPDVTKEKGMASLRTATAHIRAALGKNSIERHLGDLQLCGAWVDVGAYRLLALEVEGAARAGDLARSVAMAKESEALYVDDFRAHDDSSGWARTIRDHLIDRRKTVLATAAESATRLGWIRDAIELATVAVALDPCFERAHRTLMQAYAAIGETDSAVRTYQRFSRNLKASLGAAPSAQTRALHQQILAPVESPAPDKKLVGREREVRALVAALEAAADGDGSDVVCLVGPPGSGREALLRAAVDRLAHASLRPVRPATASRRGPTPARVTHDGRTDVAVKGPVDTRPERAHAELREMLASIDPQAGRVLVALTSGVTARLLAADPDARYRVTTVQSGPLDESDLRLLSRVILTGPPTPHLIATLRSVTDDLAGRAVAQLRAWMAAGQIISTPRGLDVVSESGFGSVMAAGATFRLLTEHLDPKDLEICQVLAVIDQDATPSTVMDVVGHDRRTALRRSEIEDRMDHLADRGFLRLSDQGYQFRDHAVRDAFELWLRPSVRARIQRRLAGGGLEDERVPAGTWSVPRALVDRRAPVRGRRAADRL